MAALVVFALGAVALGLLIVRVGPERAKEKALGLVPGALVSVAVPEGFNQFQIADRLQALDICSRAEFLAAARDPALLRNWRIQAASAEGYLAPATYQFLRGISAARVLGAMVESRQRDLARLKKDISESPWSELQILTMASIVERETAVSEERPRVAQVFFNRLAAPDGPTRGRLQSDPTAVYGCLTRPELESCVQAGGRATPAVLRDTQNPYNTYRYAGLPPGPIANPGVSSIVAVLHPSGGDDLYFVADGSGRHRFSRDFRDHKQAVEDLKALREADP